MMRSDNKTVLKEPYIEKLQSQIDCIEVHNGRNISTDYDIKQNEIAEKYNLAQGYRWRYPHVD